FELALRSPGYRTTPFLLRVEALGAGRVVGTATVDRTPDGLALNFDLSDTVDVPIAVACIPGRSCLAGTDGGSPDAGVPDAGTGGVRGWWGRGGGGAGGRGARGGGGGRGGGGRAGAARPGAGGGGARRRGGGRPPGLGRHAGAGRGDAQVRTSSAPDLAGVIAG